MNLVLRRQKMTDQFVSGALFVGDEFECYTIERPWLENRKNISCIPPGRYKIVLEFSARFNRVLPELKGVPGRDEIKIHPANWAHELNGCVAVGTGRSEDHSMVTQSKKAFARLFDKMLSCGEGEEIWFEVRNPESST